MRQMFVNKVKEAEAELKEKEKEVSGGSVVQMCVEEFLVVCSASHLSLPPAP